MNKLFVDKSTAVKLITNQLLKYVVPKLLAVLPSWLGGILSPILYFVLGKIFAVVAEYLIIGAADGWIDFTRWMKVSGYKESRDDLLSAITEGKSEDEVQKFEDKFDDDFIDAVTLRRS